MKFIRFFIVLSSFFSLSIVAGDLTQNTDKVIPEVGKFDPEIEGFSPMPHNNLVQANEDGVAIDGFDSVAYFTQEKAVKGSSEFSCEYQNRTWHFSSAENRDAFLANPEKFSPQYGGYCAHSLTNDKVVRSNPESFAVRDNKLYLYVNDRVAKKDVEKKENIFANSEKARKKNWFKFESRF